MDQQQLEHKIKIQESQIDNLKSTVKRLQQYIATLDKKLSRINEMTRANVQEIDKISRTVNSILRKD